MDIKIEPSWKALLGEEFDKPYFQNLIANLKAEKEAGHTIFPKGSEIFRAFALTPVDKVKVVILGQDPYHGVGQAHGLAFSVPKGVPVPPSLVNIGKEIESDLGIPRNPQSGDLSSWAAQGVLLLNSVLTVRAHEPTSHQSFGWQAFTDAVISKLSANKAGLVFMIWGGYARSKKKVIVNTVEHLILEAAHPSPLSAYNGFYGCKHFSKANTYLKQKEVDQIDWQIS